MILAKAGPGIRFNEHMEGDGEIVFRHACKLGLEGIVSKRKDFSLPLRPLGRLAHRERRIVIRRGCGPARGRAIPYPLLLPRCLQAAAEEFASLTTIDICAKNISAGASARRPPGFRLPNVVPIIRPSRSRPRQSRRRGGPAPRSSLAQARALARWHGSRVAEMMPVLLAALEFPSVHRQRWKDQAMVTTGRRRGRPRRRSRSSARISLDQAADLSRGSLQNHRVHLALEHPCNLFICVTVRLNLDAGPYAPSDEHRLIAG
jgi:hypothetical protein